MNNYTPNSINQSQSTLKNCAWVSIGAFFALLILTLMFFKEKLLFADTAFAAFELLNSDKLLLIGQRFGAVISKLLPYLFHHLNMPATSILGSFLLSFNLFYLLIVGILFFGYKQYKLVTLMGISYTLMVSASFFLPADLNLATGYMFLLLGTTLFLGNKKASTVITIPVFAILSYLTLTTHFIIIIPLVYLWIYLILDKELWPYTRRMTIILSCIIVATILGQLVNTTSEKSYDSQHLYGITHFSIKDILLTFNRPVVWIFLYRCITNYWAGLLVFTFGLIHLFRLKDKKHAWWTIISALGYLIIMGLSYGDLDETTELFHIELEWMSLGIIIATPFVFSFLCNLKNTSAVALLTIIIMVRLVYICSWYPTFHYRVEFEQNILVQMKKKSITKLAMYEQLAIDRKYIQTWAMPYESLLLCIMNKENTQMTFTFFNSDRKEMIAGFNDAKGFYNSFNIIPAAQANQKYFHIDATKPYQIMSYEDLMR